MGAESLKAKPRLLPLLVGRGLDIGCGSNPITDDCDRWDWEQGDAQFLEGVPDETYDWIFSSHLLEHLRDPTAAVARWWRALKTGGYLILLVPDEDLYEQGVWPPRFNDDHKHTFTPSKYESWSPASLNCTTMIQGLYGHRLINLCICDTGYDYIKQGVDQSSVAHGDAEVSVQMIVRKDPVVMKYFRKPLDIVDTHFIDFDPNA